MRDDDDLIRRNLPPLGADGMRHWPANAAMVTASAPAVVEGHEVFSEAQQEVLGSVIAQLRHEFAGALDRHSREIKALGQRLDVEIALDRKLGALKSDVDRARQRQPDFES